MAYMRAPIPGQSLTKAPGASDWEKPPKYADPEQAFNAYIDNIEDNDKKDRLFSVLEAQVPITNIVSMWVREGARNGIHSVDTGIIIKPMLHEYIVSLAEAADINYVEHPKDLIKDTVDRREQNSKLSPIISREVNKQSGRPELLEPDQSPADTRKPSRGIMAPRNR